MRSLDGGYSMVSEKLLLDLSLKRFCWQYEENRIYMCDCAGKKMSAMKVYRDGKR